MAQFKVNYPHLGDHMYAEGDTREAELIDVQHLVENGMLSPIDGAPEPPIKAETEATKGKGKK